MLRVGERYGRQRRLEGEGELGPGKQPAMMMMKSRSLIAERVNFCLFLHCRNVMILESNEKYSITSNGFITQISPLLH